jgi:hypothetical protein
VRDPNRTITNDEKLKGVFAYFSIHKELLYGPMPVVRRSEPS